MRVVVVGAGLAGLAAGVALSERGVEVELLERSRLLGGKATSFTVDGIEVDSGQHVHLACCTEYRDFVAQVGMAEALVEQERFDVVALAEGRPPQRLREAPLPAPLHLLASFAAYRHLGPAARLAVARALLAARRPARVGETAAAWLHRQRQPAAALTAFWEPFIVPALNAPLDAVDAESMLFTVRTAFLDNSAGARIGWSRTPLARIAEAAAQRLHSVRLRTPVAGLAGSPAGVHGVVLDDGSTVEADAVVLAVPPARLRRILGHPELWGVAGLAAYRALPIVDVHLWYGGARFPHAFAALLGSPVQWVFQKDAGYLCCSLSAAAGTVALPEQRLVEICHAEIVRAVPQLRAATLLRGAAVRDPEATVLPPLGGRAHGNGTRAANLVLAGAWTDTGWPPTMESAVRSGRAAAAALAGATVAPLRAAA